MKTPEPASYPSNETEIWFLDNDLLSANPMAGTKRIVETDRKIAERTDEECPDESKLVMMSLALFSSIIAGYYQDHESWKNEKWLKASMNLAVLSWNYLSMVRHAITLGYYGEAHSLRRSWFERITRAYLLITSQSEELATRWLETRLTNQTEVIELIRDRMQDAESASEMYETLIAKWKYLNEHSHPDVESLLWRTTRVNPKTFLDDRKRALRDVVGENPVLGGIASTLTQRAALLRLTEDILTSCSMLVVIASNKEEWHHGIENLYKRRQELIDANDLERPLSEYEGWNEAVKSKKN